MWLKKRSKFVEVLIGLAMPLAVLMVSMIVIRWDGFSTIGNAIFVSVFFTVSPLMFSPTIGAYYLIVPLLGLSLFPIIIYINGPYLRFVVAAIYCGWLYVGVLSAAMLY